VSRICPVCSHESPDEARYCFNSACLTPLDPEHTGAPPPAARPPEEHRRMPRWAWGAGATVAAAIAGGVLVTTGVLDSSAAKPAPPPTTVVVTTVAPSTTTAAAPASTAPVRGTPLDPGVITGAQASSTLPDQDGLTYGIANTLDGQITTAWNSEGSTPGKGVPPVGQKLDYTLASRQHVVGVRIINGFNPGDSQHKFTDNHRVQTMAIRGGGQERQVDLADSFSPQFVEVDFPNTDTLELEVLSVYPTTKWPDVGITEVQIFVTSP